jgi:hypothetical protein
MQYGTVTIQVKKSLFMEYLDSHEILREHSRNQLQDSDFFLFDVFLRLQGSDFLPCDILILVRLV